MKEDAGRIQTAKISQAQITHAQITHARRGWMDALAAALCGGALVAWSVNSDHLAIFLLICSMGLAFALRPVGRKP